MPSRGSRRASATMERHTVSGNDIVHGEAQLLRQHDCLRVVVYHLSSPTALSSRVTVRRERHCLLMHFFLEFSWAGAPWLQNSALAVDLVGRQFALGRFDMLSFERACQWPPSHVLQHWFIVISTSDNNAESKAGWQDSCVTLDTVWLYLTILMLDKIFWTLRGRLHMSESCCSKDETPHL